MRPITRLRRIGPTALENEGRTIARRYLELSLSVLGFLVLGLFLVAPSPAAAILIERDLNAPGDKLLTFDTTTGFEWLDLTATNGFSYNQTLLSPFVTAQGFSPANIVEVGALYDQFGTVNQTGSFSFENFLEAVQILDILGCTFGCTGPIPVSNGRADLASFSPTLVGVGVTQVDFRTGQARVDTASSVSPVSKDQGNIGFGVFLRRQTVAQVPEPGALYLFMAGLIPLGLLLRRRREVRGLTTQHRSSMRSVFIR